VEEEGVVGAGFFDEPVHGAEDVGFGWLGHGVVLVVGQDHHVFSGVAEALVEVGRHVFDVVDAAAELATLAKVVDPNQKGFSSPGTVTVLEGVAVGGSMAELLWCCAWRWRHVWWWAPVALLLLKWRWLVLWWVATIAASILLLRSGRGKTLLEDNELESTKTTRVTRTLYPP